MEEIEISSENKSSKAKERNWKKFLKMYLVLGVLFLIMFTMRSTLTGLQMFVPYISLSIGEPVEIIVIMFIIYSSVAAVFSLLVGPITERIGYKIVMNVGMFTFAIAIMLISIAPKFWLMCVGEAIAGFGGACFGTGVIAYAGDYFPKKYLSTAIGLIMSAFYVGTIVAVPLIALVAEKLVWRWGLGIMAILSFIVFVLILLIVPRIKGKKSKHLEVEVSEEFDEIENERINEPKDQTYFTRMKIVLQNKYALGTFFITLFQRGGLFGMITLLSTWLDQDNFWNGFEYGLSKTQIGLIFLGSGVASLVSNTIFSYIADRIGRRKIILIGTSLTGLSIGVFPLVGELTRNIPLTIFGIMVINFFGGIAMGSYNAFVTQVAPKSKGTVVAINNSFGQISQLIANALIATFVWNLTGNYAYCSLVALGLFIIAVILMYFIIKPESFFEHRNLESNSIM